MSQIAHPYGYRLVTLRPWKSRWFATDAKKFRTLLRADTLLREYLETRLRGMYVADVELERNRKSTRIIIHTSRPGMIIGRNGESAQKLRTDINAFFKKHNLGDTQDLKVDIVEVAQPEANAMIIAQTIAEGIRRRMPFRRLMKQGLEKALAVKGVQGCRIVASGLMGGSATMKRREQVKRGSVPLQFIRADIDYAYLPMKGKGIGIKVWVYKGDSLENQKRTQAPATPNRG